MNSSYSDLTVVSKFPCFPPRLFDLRCGKLRGKRGHRTKTCSKFSYLSLKVNVVSVVPKVDNILSSIHPSKPRPFPNLWPSTWPSNAKPRLLNKNNVQGLFSTSTAVRLYETRRPAQETRIVTNPVNWKTLKMTSGAKRRLSKNAGV